MREEELVQFARKGDNDAISELITRLLPVVHLRAREYSGTVEWEDLVQEGLIGVLAAIYRYRPGGEAGFRTYASACINNSMRTALRKASRQKRRSCGVDVSLDAETLELSDMEPGPEERVIAREEFNRINRIIAQELSVFERDVVTLHLSGCGYREIAQRLQVSEKSVDNALSRVRRKLRDSRSS